VPIRSFPAGRQQIVALAARDTILTMYTNHEFVQEGGLISYGNDTADGHVRAGVYAGRILNGAKPADLAVDQATKFELVVNVKATKAIGLTIPESFLARADEVIE
jgi:putative ABC transport system substrate-binding protein